MSVIQVILQIMSLVGSLVLFLYGMKIMSESLQKFAGSNMRNVLAKITSRPSRGILTGFLITSAIQSSSATTVMLVGFVNAGLISFTESLGVIFGANIGTTFTAWIIAILGFGNNFSLSSVMLPLVALSLPLFFSYNSKNKAGAEFIIGFALLFIGIYFFRENLPVIDENLSLFHKLQLFESSFFNTLMFIGLGLFITIIFQSSSATITLTMVLASQGWLSFDAALAMVLGENIGTTVTANVAALVANRSAKRTALAHFLFNIIGMLWVLPFLGIIPGFISSVAETMVSSPSGYIPMGIAIFHTSFNVINTILLTLLFVPFRNLNLKLLPVSNGLNEHYSLKYIDTNLVSTAELSILQARKEIAHMGRQVTTMFLMIPDLLLEKQDKKFEKKFAKVERVEDIIDKMELDIANYIARISEDELSENGSRRVKAMLEIIDNLESIADVCFQMAIAISKKNEAKAWFTQELRNNLNKDFNLLEKSLNHMVAMLEKDYLEVDMTEAENIHEQIKSNRNKLKKNYMDEISREKLPYKTGIFYNDLLSASKKIGNYAFAVHKSMVATRLHHTTKINEPK